MHGRVTVVQGEVERLDEWVRYMKEQILPPAQELDGFRGLVAMADRSSGKTLTVSLWESEEALQASEDAVSQLRATAVESLGMGTPIVERYEVSVFELA